MLKATLLAAGIFAAALFFTPTTVTTANAQANPNANTLKFMQDATMPYAATSKPAAKPKAAKKGKKKKAKKGKKK